MTSPELQAAIVRFARELPRNQVDEAADLIAGARGPEEVVARIISLVPNARYHALARDMTSAWAASRATSDAVALALRAAADMANIERLNEQLEVVWTGPSVTGIPVRHTQAVLLEVVKGAKNELTLVSFAAYKTKAVTDALKNAADAGVVVRLVLDGGTDAELAFASLGDAIALYTWPPTLLPHHDPGHSSLHAKAAIADERVAFVTSANLTGYALDRNMELGLLITGGPVPARLASHFRGLASTEILVPWVR